MSGSRACAELVSGSDPLRQNLLWEDRSVAAALARRLISELAALQPGRLRQCARPECTLLFYDVTRSRTRRWHAQDPCGWRDRQLAHRAAGLSS
jgi:predicted RNA-binding Zn ribbon-like protein